MVQYIMLTDEEYEARMEKLEELLVLIQQAAELSHELEFEDLAAILDRYGSNDTSVSPISGEIYRGESGDWDDE